MKVHYHSFNIYHFLSLSLSLFLILTSSTCLFQSPTYSVTPCLSASPFFSIFSVSLQTKNCIKKLYFFYLSPPFPPPPSHKCLISVTSLLSAPPAGVKKSATAL